jgi:predicted TIM-barrel fold metal-dependent hydrolase
MNESAEFLSDFPGIPVVIDHAGCPYDQSGSGLRIWKRSLNSLTALPNLHIKLSGFGMYDKNCSSESTQIIFDTILENFNPNRIMWVSNFPFRLKIKIV